MRDDLVFGLVIVVAAASCTTAIATVWIAVKVSHILHDTRSGAVSDRHAIDERVQDGLVRIESAVMAAKDVAQVARETMARVAEQVSVAAELAYQTKGEARNALATATRIEVAQEGVAADLEASHERADAAEGPHGAAADAASRNAHPK